jgi:hypothetical protein
VSGGWLDPDAVLDLVPVLMRGNAERALPRRPAPRLLTRLRGEGMIP